MTVAVDGVAGSGPARRRHRDGSRRPAVPTAAAIGAASSVTTTVSTETSASIRSVVRTSGSRPNRRSRMGHRGRRTVIGVHRGLRQARQCAVPR